MSAGYKKTGYKKKSAMALILVVVVISALLIIATPFAISMRLAEKSSRSYSSEVEARFLAQATLNHSIAFLYKTHEDTERKTFLQKKKQGAGANPSSASEDPRYDSPKEWTIIWPKNFGRDVILLKDGTLLKGEILSERTNEVVFRTKKGQEVRDEKYSKSEIQSLIRGRFSTANPRGKMVKSTVEDDQGKIDLNNCPPRVIGVILGATILKSDIKSDTLGIPVSDTSPFYTDHNKKTIDGLLRIDGEYIAYRDLGTIKMEDGTTSPALKGCLRGLYLSNLLGNTFGEHKAGALIYDARGFKVAFHPAWSSPGKYRPYRTVSQVREIANWSLLELRVHILRGIGMTDDFLKGAGITDSTLKTAGLAMENFKVKVEPLTDKEKALLRKLTRAGVNLEKIKELGPGHLKKRLQSLVKLSEENLKKYLENKKWIDRQNRRIALRSTVYKTFQTRLSERLPDALKNMAVLIANLQKTNFNVEALGAVEMERLKRYFSVYPSRSQQWTDYRNLIRNIEPRAFQWSSQAWIPYTPAIGRFGMVEVRQGNLVEYRRAWWTRSFFGQNTRVWMIPPLVNAYMAPSAKIRATIRPNINVNSAPKEVLKALFTGLRLRGSKDYISLREAETLANLLIQARQKGGIQGFESLSQLVLDGASPSGATTPVYDMEQGYSLRDGQALLVNAISPTSSWLSRGTFGFTFATGNVYTIQSEGIINGEDGSPMASHGFKEVVQVAPPRPLQWIKSSQFDFTSEIKFLGKTLSLSGRKLRNLSTYPISPYVIPSPRSPWVSPDTTMGKGEFRLSRIRLPQSRSYSNNFDDGKNWIDEGFKMDGQVHTVPTMAQAGGLKGFPTTLVTLQAKKTAVKYPVVSPGRVAFWVKPLRSMSGGLHTLFDTGEGEKVSRILLAYDGNRRKLVFSVADDSISSRVNAVEASINFRANRWYHICAYYRGSNPWDLSLFVDGKLVGKPRYVCRLRTTMNREIYQISVDNAMDFPPYGVLQIGGESVDYVARRGNTFQLATKQVPLKQKGPKGQTLYKTVRAYRRGNSSHTAGTLVSLYGYADPLANKMIVGRCALASELKTPTPILYLRKSNPKKILPIIQRTDTSIPINPKYYSINKNQTFTLPNGKNAPLKYQIGDFPPEGYIRISGRIQSSLTPPSQPASEIAYYQSIQGDSFTGVTRGEEGTTAQDFTELTSIFLLSIKVSAPTDYPLLGKIQLYRDNNYCEWLTYTKAKSRPNFFLFSRDYGPGQIYLAQQASHVKGELVMPVYRSWRSGHIGKGDRVTLYDRTAVSPQLKRSPMEISRVLGREYAFTSHIIRPFEDFFTAFGLMLKWPTGLLPLETQQNMTFGGRGTPLKPGTPPTGEYFAGVYDELFVQRVGGTRTNLSLIGSQGQRFGIKVAIRTSLGLSQQGTTIALRSYGTKRQLDNMAGYLKFLQGLKSSPTLQRQIKRLQKFVQSLQNQFARRKNKWSAYVHWFLRPSRGYLNMAGGWSDWWAASQRISEMQKLREGGLVRIGNEVIYTRGIDYKNNTLVGVVRNLGGVPASYGAEEPIYGLEWPLAGRVIGLDSSRVYLNISRPSVLPIPASGYVFFSKGGNSKAIMAYKRLRLRRRKQKTTLQLWRCRDYLGNPIFNRCFGSQGASFGAGDVGLFLPWRYSDRYEPQRETEDGAFYQASFRPEKAYFRKIWWESVVTPGTVIKVQVRIDGKPEWTAKPNTPIGGSTLYEFTRTDKAWIGKRGDELEYRVYFAFKPGAYRAGLWKETPVLNRIGVEYSKKTRVLYHEELVK